VVRSGVALDHPKIKTVSKVFEKIPKDNNFNYLLYDNCTLIVRKVY
jgi:hypothetical protein